jgi:Zn-dependent protease
MQPNLGFSRWAIPLGTWLGVRVRLNVWYPLVVLLFVHWVGWELGLLCSAILFVTTVIHEFAHVLTARATGGDGEEILLWPLGGLAFTQPAPTFASQFWTPAAGPLSDAALCLLTLPVVLKAGLLAESLNPAVLPIAGLGDNLVRDILLLTFSLNWILLLLNLIPAYPLDGGQMLAAVLGQRMGRGEAKTLSVRVGWVAGVVLAFGGLLFDMSFVVFLGFFLVVMNLQEIFRLQVEEMYGEGGYGEDYSASYSAADSDAELPGAKLSYWQRWKQGREAARRERELEERAANARRVDELLDKVHQVGMHGLTSEERRFLDRMSSQYRTQGGKHPG